MIWGDNSDPRRELREARVRPQERNATNTWIEFLKTTDGVTDFGDGDPYWNSGLGNYGPRCTCGSCRPAAVVGVLVGRRRDVHEGRRHPPDRGHREPAGRPHGAEGHRRRPPEVDARSTGSTSSRARPAAAEAPDCLTQHDPETGFEHLRRHPGVVRGVGARGPGLLHPQRPTGSMTSGNTAEAPNYGLHWYTAAVPQLLGPDAVAARATRPTTPACSRASPIPATTRTSQSTRATRSRSTRTRAATRRRRPRSTTPTARTTATRSRWASGTTTRSPSSASATRSA